MVMIALKFSHFTKTYRPQVVQSLNEEDYGKCLTFACVFERKFWQGQAPVYEYTWPWLQQNMKLTHIKKPEASKEVRPFWKKHPKGRYHTRIVDPFAVNRTQRKRYQTHVVDPTLTPLPF